MFIFLHTHEISSKYVFFVFRFNVSKTFRKYDFFYKHTKFHKDIVCFIIYFPKILAKSYGREKKTKSLRRGT